MSECLSDNGPAKAVALGKPVLETQSKMWVDDIQAECQLMAFATPDPKIEIIAVVKGTVRDEDGVPVRVHSECFTGDVLGSQRCDCGQQLHKFMRIMNDSACGVLLYIRGQEGRGIGLFSKIRAYHLQDQGHDTVDANLKLGLPVDIRSYEDALRVLQDLGLKSVRLYTNNPDKMTALKSITQEVAALASVPSAHSAAYLKTKRERLNHRTVLETFKLPELGLEKSQLRIGLVYTTWNQYFARSLAFVLIMHTMGDFRRREVRKWRFGTHFTECHDYEEWDQSIDADRVSQNYTTTFSSKSEFTPTHGILDEPDGNYTDTGAQFLSPCKEASSSSTTTRPFFDLSFAESTDNESNAPSFDGGTGSSFRPDDASPAVVTGTECHPGHPRGIEIPNLDPRTWAHGQPTSSSNPSTSIATSSTSAPVVYNAPIPPPTTPRPPAQRLEGFRMLWPESQVVDKGRTSLNDLRSNPTTPEVPQFGFNTKFRFDQFPILHGTLNTLLPVGGPNVAMMPPGNHPHAAFSEDSPWQITYDGSEII
eukprot:s3548_g10.t1